MPAIDPLVFRHVLGHLPTGVTIITGSTEEGPIGVSCNSVTSVSLVPALVSFCPARTSETWPALRASGRFCVNVMAEHHEALIRRFARKHVDRFAGVSWHGRDCGPALDDAIAWLDCTLYAEHEAGDHFLVIAQVHRLDAAGGGAPLVFFRGAYGTFSPATPGRGDGVRGKSSSPGVDETTSQRPC